MNKQVQIHDLGIRSDKDKAIIEKIKKKVDITKGDSVSTEIKVYKTKDYEKFYRLKENRNIKTSLVNKLKESFLKKEWSHYISVTPTGGIIDGQHTFTARKILGLPIYYTIVEDYESNQMIAMNTHQGWIAQDFVQSYNEMDNPEYKALVKFMKEYPHFGGLRGYISICNFANREETKNRSKAAIINGEFIFGDYEKVKEVADKLMEFEFIKKQGRPCWGHTEFYIALLKLFNYEKYNHDVMKRRLQTYGFSLSRNINIKNYLQNLCEIYNRDSTRKKLIWEMV